jgi:hypothetical protein
MFRKGQKVPDRNVPPIFTFCEIVRNSPQKQVQRIEDLFKNGTKLIMKQLEE